MTTTVTLKTHDWPVKVVTEDHQDYRPHVDTHVRSHAVTTETVEPNSERTFHITDTRTIAFYELPLPAAEAA